MRRRVSKVNAYPPAHISAWRCTGAQRRRSAASCSTWSSSCFVLRAACGSTVGGTSYVVCVLSLCAVHARCAVYPDLLVLTASSLSPPPPGSHVRRDDIVARMLSTAAAKYFCVVEADPSMPPDKEQRDVHVLYRESVVQSLTDTGRSSSSPSAAASTFSALYAADADATADVSKEGPKRACRATPAPAAGANPAEAAARVDNAVVVKLEKKRKRTAEDAARAQDSERSKYRSGVRHV